MTGSQAVHLKVNAATTPPPSPEPSTGPVTYGVNLTACNSATVPANAVYVSISGNDSTANGSQSLPYRTIRTAVNNAVAGATIVIRGGTYVEPQEIRVRVPNVTIRSYPGEWAVIDRSADTENVGMYFYVGSNGGKLQCLEVKGGFYAVSTETQWDWGQSDRSGVSDLLIENTKLHDSFRDVVKIKPNSDRITIRHNEIYNSNQGQTGECNAEGIDNVNGDNMLVQYNHIHHTCSTGVYMKGGATDGIVEYNLIENTGAAGIILGFDTSPEFFDLTVNPDYYENIRGIARYNLVRNTGWGGIALYASKDGQVYNNTLIDTARTYHSPIYYGITFQDWDSTAKRPANINPTVRDNIVVQNTITRATLVGIRYANELGGLSALSGGTNMNNNCYYQATRSATFEDGRTGWSGNFTQWQSHINGESGSVETNPNLDGNYKPTAQACVNKGHLANTSAGSNTGSPTPTPEPEPEPTPEPTPEPEPAPVPDNTPIQGTVWHVDDDNKSGTYNGTAQYPDASIQYAINRAASGDTIKLAAGNYGPVNTQGKSLTILGGYTGASSAAYAAGQGGNFTAKTLNPALTSISGGANQNGVTFTRFNSQPYHGVLDNVRVNNNQKGIVCDTAASWPHPDNITISNSLIENNGANGVTTRGAGIMVCGANSKIINNIIRNNQGGRGAGLYGSASNSILVDGNRIQDNTCYDDHGGGVYLNGKITFSNNTVSGNRVAMNYGWGGGVLFHSADTVARMSFNKIYDNYSPLYGAGVFIDEGATAYMDNDLVYRNRTGNGQGAGIAVDDGPSSSRLYITNSTIAYNNAASGSSGNGGNGVYADNSSTATISNSIFWGNGDDFYVRSGSTISATYTLSQEAWTGTGNLTSDPRFADPANNDFHVRSQTGRYNPANGQWIVDSLHSPAIDAGNPSTAFNLETAPNGGRVNLGAYGNTAQASRSK